MTVPSRMADLPRREDDRKSLDDQLSEARKLLHAAKQRQGRLNYELPQATGRLARQIQEIGFLPPSAGRSEDLERRKADLRDREERHRFANAEYAGAELVERAAQQAVARATESANAPFPHHGDPRAELLPPTDRASALFYTVTSYRPNRRGAWVAGERLDRKAQWVNSLIATWRNQPGAQVLRDSSGTLFIATSSLFIEMKPVVEPEVEEGDVLVAALKAYGWDAEKDDEGGATHVIVFLDPTRHDQTPYPGRYVMIAADVDRPIVEHDAPWTADLFGTDGEYVKTIYEGSEAIGIVSDSARCARALTQYVTERPYPGSTGF
ncbi:hypothetical protein ABT024_05225 [Streptomyces sp. NPDC002812]|uniref:hypothetical protein n=1 Tax=Streptomyces sp. NPDC002812 TaxID=3154434 RepID=UPI003325E41E